jgi:hypothetical protein
MKMDTNDKIERLLDMTEHPDRYSEEEIQQMMADDEIREYYELMVKTDSAYTPLPDADAEKALREFEEHHVQSFSWRKIAAIFIGIITFSCLTYAAIVIHQHSMKPQEVQMSQTGNFSSQSSVNQGKAETTDSVGEKEKVYDDVELQAILKDVSVYYNLQLEYKSEAPRHLRLHLLWDKTQGPSRTIETLNHFEKVNITLNDGKITVE